MSAAKKSTATSERARMTGVQMTVLQVTNPNGLPEIKALQ